MLPRLRANWIAWLCLALLIGVLMIYRYGMPETPREILITTLAMFSGATGGILAGFLCSLTFVLLSSRAGNGVLGEHFYTLREEGLHARTAVNESLAKWEGIEGAKKTASYIYVQITPWQYHVFPRRDFDNAEAYEQFWDTISKFTIRDA